MSTEVFKRTSDNWAPSYPFGSDEGIPGHGLVKVVFTQTGPSPPASGEWRVAAWGADDFGMVRDFTDQSEAWHLFLEVIGMEDVTTAELTRMGFVCF